MNFIFFFLNCQTSWCMQLLRFFFYPFQHFKLHVREMFQVGIIPLIRYKLVQGLFKILNANYTPILYLVSNSEFVNFKLQYSSGSQICNKLINLILFFIFQNWFYYDLTVHSFLSQQHFINLDISHWNLYLVDFIFFFNFCNNQNITIKKKIINAFVLQDMKFEEQVGYTIDA